MAWQANAHLRIPSKPNTVNCTCIFLPVGTATDLHRRRMLNPLTTCRMKNRAVVLNSADQYLIIASFIASKTEILPIATNVSRLVQACPPRGKEYQAALPRIAGKRAGRATSCVDTSRATYRLLNLSPIILDKDPMRMMNAILCLTTGLDSSHAPSAIRSELDIRSSERWNILHTYTISEKAGHEKTSL